MFYIIDTQGTTKAVITEPIYQGSVGVNNIVLLAPFPANAQISVYATLPNGISLRNLYQLSATTFPQGVPNLRDENGNIYTAFSGKIHESLTSYPGIVEIWFKVALGVGRELHTYKTSFNVAEGGISDPISIPSDEQYIDEILQYLAELNSDPIKSITYTATGYIMRANSIETNVPDYVDTSANGNIKHIDAEGEFINAPPSQETTTVAMAFDTSAELGLLQFWMQSPTNGNIVINAYAYFENVGVADKTITITPTSQSVAINPRIFLESVKADTIEIEIISPNDTVIVKGVQVFKSNIDGEYVITQKSGAIAVINAPDGNIIKGYYESAEQSKNSAESAYQDTLRIKDETQQIYQNASALEQNVLALKNTAEEAKEAAVEEAAYAAERAANAATSATNAATSASQAQSYAQEANNALQTMLGRRTVYYEETLQLALDAIVNNGYTFTSGDMFIIGALNVPDLVVFAADEEPIATATETITQQQIINNSFNIVAGGRYKLQNSNGVVQWGVVAIESGLSENVVTQTQFTNFANGINSTFNIFDARINTVSADLSDFKNEVSEMYATKEELTNKQDKLTIDIAPMPDSRNPVQSGGTYDYINAVANSISAELANKQDKLTFDNAPTLNSQNPVTSGGVYSAIDGAVQHTNNEIESVVELVENNYTSKEELTSEISTVNNLVKIGEETVTEEGTYKVTIPFDYPVNEFYVVANIQSDATVNKRIVVRENVGSQQVQYFMYLSNFASGSPMRYWTCHAKEIVAKNTENGILSQWETIAPAARYDAIGTAPKQAYYNWTERADYMPRYCESIEIYFGSEEENIQFIPGSKITVYGRRAPQ
ncbi:MAG: hypothetical protein E7017_07770 [Alphaproteobacteria bacterium]|nr:hypothetical protein [Alphaproteobacteria bacterium]